GLYAVGPAGDGRDVLGGLGVGIAGGRLRPAQRAGLLGVLPGGPLRRQPARGDRRYVLRRALVGGVAGHGRYVLRGALRRGPVPHGGYVLRRALGRGGGLLRGGAVGLASAVRAVAGLLGGVAPAAVGGRQRAGACVPGGGRRRRARQLVLLRGRGAAGLVRGGACRPGLGRRRA